LPIVLLLPALQLLHPMPGVITQGVREGHPAIDIACIPGTPVRAAHDGTARIERSYTHGITLVLNGSDGLITRYSHLQSAGSPGPVMRGDQIGSCGNTGIWSSGPHLHFESNRPELLVNLLREPAAVPGPFADGAPRPVIGAVGGSPTGPAAPR
jgi:murein DD-endopeptidase MepM/ murein hydrolase activator NlpD